MNKYSSSTNNEQYRKKKSNFQKLWSLCHKLSTGSNMTHSTYRHCRWLREIVWKIKLIFWTLPSVVHLTRIIYSYPIKSDWGEKKKIWQIEWLNIKSITIKTNRLSVNIKSTKITREEIFNRKNTANKMQLS